MELRLTAVEEQTLQRILTNYLGDLRMEIADTENYEYKEGLKDDEEAIKSILTKLEATIIR